MGKNIVKSWDEIKEKWANYEKFSCQPANYKKMKEGTIIDEEMSVRWNKEQVAKNNEGYNKELVEKQKEKNKLRDDVLQDIYAKIVDEVGYNLTNEKARAIWDKAYADGHSCGFSEILIYLDEYIDLAITLLM
jgi:DNA replicative helicase MCM subunit Mcm2 (Cdc46/Mcm family)